MHLVKFETQGESQTALINPQQVAYIAEGLYGTSIHFASGEYVICHGDIDDIAQRLTEGGGSDSYLISATEPART
ncbi:hypothetical protein ACFFF7_11085 [Novosphingobium aquiterrae]|uniref:Uncharacterized protein n=1 Tax=Novosphingobium aquiterrae TaxID=624388 RepID=A0ABV6PK62_9SPHN